MKFNFTNTILMVSKWFLHLIVLLSVTMNFVAASESNAQAKSVKEVEISMKMHEAALGDVFKGIESLTDYRFSISEDKVNLNQSLSIDVQNVTVEDILLYISEKTNLQFKQINNSIGVRDLSKLKQQKPEKVIIQTSVSGTITDERGETLPGATVQEKGTSNGTITDINGAFSLDVNENATLVISFVGYAATEIPINGRSTINVKLADDVSALQEVVVIGYGQQRRKDLSGAVVSVDSKTLEQTPNVSFEQALQGRVPGVQITQSSNAPGGGISVRIRGGNSITGGNEPLYVIDGVQINVNNDDLNPGGNNSFTLNKDPAGNALASLNPQDIASIEVLKDASATAIYGSRGSNGVVLITTKQGNIGRNTFSYESFYSLQEAATRYDAMNAEEYLDFYNDLEANRQFPDGTVRTLAPELTAGFANTDWQDEIFNPSWMQSQTFRFAGGNENLSYNASFNYFDQDGVVEGTGFERYSVRLNTNGQVNDKISFGNSFTFTNSTRNAGIVNGNGHRGDDVVMAALQSPAIQPVRDEDGFLYLTTRDWQNGLEAETGENFLYALGRTQNPLVTVRESVNDIRINRMLGNIFGQYEVMEGLRFRVSIGGDFADATRDYFLSSLLRQSGEEGFAVKSMRRNITLINTNTVHYDKDLGNSSLSVMGGFEVQTNRNESLRAASSDFFTNAFQNHALQAGNQFEGPVTDLTEWSLMSFFGRANYILSDRYIFTATMRGDGSSRFGAGNRWGFFPSGAFAWRLSNEAFLQNVTFINDAKFRVSYGLTGNTDIGAFRSLATYSPTGSYLFGGSQFSGTSPDRVANPDLKWERTAQWNVGLDLALAQNKVALTAEVYQKTTNDLLLERSIPATSGFSTSLQNIGSVENRGVEISINTENISTQNFTWSTSANISFNRNEVLNLAGEEEIILGSDLCDRACWADRDILLALGQPVGMFRGYVFDGLWQNQEQIDGSSVNHTVPNPRVGGVRYADVNNDGSVDTDDIVAIGDPNPNFIYGISNTFTLGNLDLSIFLQGTQGNDVMNHTLNDLLYMGMGGRQSRLAGSANGFRLDGSNPNNATTDVPWAGTGHNVEVDSRIVEDGSFLQIRNLILGYDLPTSSISWLRSLRVYASVQNLATFTNYSGYDPDVNIGGQSNIVRGKDLVGLPITRSYTIGLNVSF